MINFGSVTISFWNVGGLSLDKLKNKFVQKHMKTDINCLIETFTTEDSKLNLEGYVFDHSFRSNSNKNARRNSGRIVVHIKSEISKGTEFLQSEHEDLIWIKLNIFST